MSHLTSTLSIEVERGCRYVYGRNMTMRFGDILYSHLSKWSSRSNHISAWKLFGEGNYGIRSLKNRSNFLNKLSVFMGYDSIEDFFEQEGTQGTSCLDAEGLVEEVDIELSCARFPCITLGNSPLVKMYDGTLCQSAGLNLLVSESCSNGYLPCSKNMMLTGPENSEMSSSGSHVSDTTSFSSNKMDFHALSCASQPHLLDSEKVQHSSKESSLTGKEAGISTAAGSILDKPIKVLEGISSRQCQQLENGGFHTVRKLLQHFPRTYADLQNSQDSISDGQYLMFVGTVLSSRGIKAGISFSFLEVVVSCDFSNSKHYTENDSKDTCRQTRIVYLHLKKYFRGTRFTNQTFLRSLQSKYKEGDHVYVSGKVKKLQAENHYEIREYSIDMLDREEQAYIVRRPYPLYPSKAGLKPGFLRDIISRALKLVPLDIDPIPDEVLNEFYLLNLRDAYMGIHHPRDLDEADSSRRRLIFDDFFYLQLGRLFQMLEALGTRIEKEDLLNRYRKQGLNTVSIDDWSILTKKFLKTLPYSLTPSQLSAASEIIWDLRRPVPMNRLLQGDVGCGKTVVAFLACMEVIGSGFQAAFMVPTELLATQHYEFLLSLLENIEGQDKPSVAILTGSTPTKQSRIIRQGLQSGDIDLVIGTHSLIAEKVEFPALRIAVVDEQQRFGVIQRGRFSSKLYYTSEGMKVTATTLNKSSDKSNMAPHVLAMSATPIPRTLALALYGDMALTQITDLPPGRVPIDTHVLQGDESGFEKVYKMMQDELLAGGKVYLVYPVIEESEQLPQLHAAAADFESISSKFQDYQCGLLHGRMKSDEKDQALKQFKSGETHILLATQVIEIGVDVPDASMMVVMNAERFGIAQLHQLRGRVGRGEKKSKCVLLASSSGALGRLKVLEKSSDGFYLANTDLLFRGPGNLLGKKQSGHLPEFPIARLEIDGNILQEAHLAALKVLGTSSDLQRFPKLKAELSMRQPLSLLGD